MKGNAGGAAGDSTDLQLLSQALASASSSIAAASTSLAAEATVESSGASHEGKEEEEAAAEEEKDAIGFRRPSLSDVTSESVASSVDLARRKAEGKEAIGFALFAQRRDVRERLVVDFFSLSFLSRMSSGVDKGKSCRVLRGRRWSRANCGRVRRRRR